MSRDELDEMRGQMRRQMNDVFDMADDCATIAEIIKALSPDDLTALKKAASKTGKGLALAQFINKRC